VPYDVEGKAEATMNIAGLMVYAYRQYGSDDWQSVIRASEELELPYDVVPLEPRGVRSPLRRPVRVTPLQEMLNLGHVGLFSVDDATYRRATHALRRVETREGSLWIEALQLPDGDWIVSPQIDTPEPCLSG
jgi:hypothetical protein